MLRRLETKKRRGVVFAVFRFAVLLLVHRVVFRLVCFALFVLPGLCCPSSLRLVCFVQIVWPGLFRAARLAAFVLPCSFRLVNVAWLVSPVKTRDRTVCSWAVFCGFWLSSGFRLVASTEGQQL